jgi:stage IV sporulation protein FB
VNVFGIRFEISWIFIAVIIGMAFLQSSLYAVLTAVSVIMHECAHLCAAKAFGYTPEKISLGVFGGVLHVKEQFLRPRQELLIHLSGPAFSLLLAGLFYCLYQKVSGHPVIIDLLAANLVVGMFNLLPFYPLDGGKVTRLYMAFFLGYGRAIRISRIISVLFCILLFFLGIYLVQYNEFNVILCGLALNLLIITKRESSFILYQTIQTVEAGSRVKSGGGKPETGPRKKNAPDRMVVCRMSERPYKHIKSYKPTENRLFTIVNNQGNFRGQLSETELLEGIYDCGIYADFEKILSIKTRKHGH